ncbi:LuxR C-terminal-related transcriptional regulator [Algoriphagus sp. AGSA1]|uniref:LuxR C-terminal-related transcriptional regulator n=1 Tax=Algoriphagus sp. AGSA1 TaxID=2907213 RepID=UPI001F22622E|nr:LuxR C-terminal-related transcriptional regulator [Algoriphagus sp. AGSA1]MCE7053437.1 LuxR C-terminal-related transcriptional regulator [Algoriphagus sp. AGSA1]
MDKLILDHAQKIWKEIAQHKTPGDLKLEIELYKKLLNIFNVGEYYYMVFNPPEMTIEYTNQAIQHVLGYLPEEFTLAKLMQIIHPDDLPLFLDFEATVTDFWSKLPPEKVMKYKSRYDYRIRKKNGKYLRILQQIITIQSDEDGAVLRTFVVHTDISHLKKDNKMVLSFIGLEGEPSYVDVKPIRKLEPQKELFTKREKQVLDLMLANKTSNDIAMMLNVSKSTIASHRKNILTKTNTHNVLDLLKLGLEKGWI